MDTHDFNPEGFSTTSLATTELPTEDHIAHTFEAIGNELGDLMLNTGLERVLEQVSMRWTSQLHSLIGFHQRSRDVEAQELKALIQCQDGSEIQSFQMEDLQEKIQQTDAIIETLEIMRDSMAANHHNLTGSAWVPQSGSQKSSRITTSSMIEAKDYLANRERAQTLRSVPEGTLVAVTGTASYTDTNRAFGALDALLAKYPDLILIHGGYNKGIDKIAQSWAQLRKVRTIKCAPDFKTYGKSKAPFARNADVIEMKPRGVLAFFNPNDAKGVAMNLLQKAEEAGIRGQRYVQPVE
jgi:hypothetical protein